MIVRNPVLTHLITSTIPQVVLVMSQCLLTHSITDSSKETCFLIHDNIYNRLDVHLYIEPGYGHQHSFLQKPLIIHQRGSCLDDLTWKWVYVRMYLYIKPGDEHQHSFLQKPLSIQGGVVWMVYLEIGCTYVCSVMPRSAGLRLAGIPARLSDSTKCQSHFCCV